MAASTVAREATGSSQGGLEPNRHWSGRASAAAPTMNTWSALDRSRSGSGCSCATSISAMEDIPPKAPHDEWGVRVAAGELRMGARVLLGVRSEPVREDGRGAVIGCDPQDRFDLAACPPAG